MAARSHHHWAYTWIPLFTAFIWCGTLVSMLITWGATGRPHYPTEGGNIPEISDVGASYLKPLFVTGCSITAVGFVLCLLAERVLRNHGRLVENFRTRERVFSWLAILGSVIGGAGLILLSVFDTDRHHNLHRIFLVVFMVGVALSAIFTILEFRWISKDFHGVRRLRIAYIMKGVIATVLIALSIAFAATLYHDNIPSQNASAIIEWTIAIGFTLYLLTFWYDLHLSKGRQRGELSADRLMAQQAGTGFGSGHIRPSTDTRATAGQPVTYGNAY